MGERGLTVAELPEPEQISVPLLEARGLVKHYGSVLALDSASFSAYLGEVVALIGAASQVASDIAAHPNLNGVFATNVLRAQGAATGVQHAGESGSVKVATFDAEPQQIAALKSNTIQLAIAQSPYQEGQDGVEQAVAALSGQPVTANIGTPLVAITQHTVNSASVQKNSYVSSC
jgi:ABC-type phosphonate transport system ATPase subunit